MRNPDPKGHPPFLQGHIERKIREALCPIHLEVINESAMHHVPSGSESHFRLVVVSEKFAGKMPVERHREVYSILSAELKTEAIHALALQTFTPQEWEKKRGETMGSPKCLGGNTL